MAEAHFLVVGAGFTGAVIAKRLAERYPCKVLVIDERPHVAGNCHTARCPRTGVMIHEYGPHIFNTNRQDVWEYVNSFGTFEAFTNRVKAHTRAGVFSLPVNLHTINQFFGKAFSPAEAAAFVARLGDQTIENPRNFEEQALKMIGRELYECFFYGYTKKQWGCEPRELPASVIKRLPVRFNYDDSYYTAKFQGIPTHGYTAIIERMLDHPKITVECGQRYQNEMSKQFNHIFYCGTLDRYFKNSLGRLGYRTVVFERHEATGDFQGNAVINYPELDVPYTRVHEHKHFAPWETISDTVYFREFSKETTGHDCPYYPKRLAGDMELLQLYRKQASEEKGVSFVGRLGTYRYINMDQAIGEAMDFTDLALAALHKGEPIPTFSGESV